MCGFDFIIVFTLSSLCIIQSNNDGVCLIEYLLSFIYTILQTYQIHLSERLSIYLSSILSYRHTRFIFLNIYLSFIYTILKTYQIHLSEHLSIYLLSILTYRYTRLIFLYIYFSIFHLYYLIHRHTRFIFINIYLYFYLFQIFIYLSIHPTIPLCFFLFSQIKFK